LLNEVFRLQTIAAGLDQEKHAAVAQLR
jgi:hypothetical protein